MLLSQRHGPLQVSYGYDRDKNLTALKALSGDEILADNLYEYDGNGNRTKKRQMEGETQYIYDGLNQLTKIEYPTLTEELFYDKAGNRTRRIAGDEEDLYSYDPRNRLVSHTRGGVTTPLVYDDAGNLLRDGRAIYEYDGFNRAVKAETFDGNIQVNRYDAEGLRYELEENGRLVQFIFHRSEVITEQNETDTIRLIRGYDLIASDAQSARTYYHYASDELGSTTHIVDEKGKVLNRYVYDAFGNITEQEETVPNRFKFNGQQFDPITQQYYLRARFYNPVVARFTQEDVYRGDGLNLYAYCHNNPVIYEDPSGYDCISGQDLIAGQRDGQLALPAPEQQLALPSPNDISQRRLQSGEIYFDPMTNRWKDSSGRFVATPTSAMPPPAPAPATPTSAASQVQINYQVGTQFDQHVQQTVLAGYAQGKQPNGDSLLQTQASYPVTGITGRSGVRPDYSFFGTDGQLKAIGDAKATSVLGVTPQTQGFIQVAAQTSSRTLVIYTPQGSGLHTTAPLNALAGRFSVNILIIPVP